jgi:adenine-specific DNA-methyltransferase
MEGHDLPENPEYLSRQLITCIGNKRALLGFIGAGVETVRKKLGKRKLCSFDVFSGSGIVARYLKQYSDKIIANDLEAYSSVINRCYLANQSEVDMQMLDDWHRMLLAQLSEDALKGGFIREMYAPASMDNILPGERCFYTPRNAMYLDTARQLLDGVPASLRHFFMAPLLSEASIHANTAGIFKGFYKDAVTGLGQFGGKNRNALLRILGPVQLRRPVFSRFEAAVEVYHGDANRIIDLVDEVDLAYIDPPYNQHPYGSNYFMLNLLLHYTRPDSVSRVSGIPHDWQRSDYNRRAMALVAMKNLVKNIKARYLLVSFSSEGFISLNEMLGLLHGIGKTQVLETRYNAYKGSRNFLNRDRHVSEYLYLVEK